MAKCTQCGGEVSIWRRNIFTGACPKCPDSSSLGCGTLLLIGFFVAAFSGGGTGDLERDVRRLRGDLERDVRRLRGDLERDVDRLRSAVGDLKEAVEAQSAEIRQLRSQLPPPASDGDEKGK